MLVLIPTIVLVLITLGVAYFLNTMRDKKATEEPVLTDKKELFNEEKEKNRM